MKSYRKELWFEANQRRQFFRITTQIEQCVEESGIAEGLVLVNAMHITASVFINDNESGRALSSFWVTFPLGEYPGSDPQTGRLALNPQPRVCVCFCGATKAGSIY